MKHVYMPYLHCHHFLCVLVFHYFFFQCDLSNVGANKSVKKRLDDDDDVEKCKGCWVNKCNISKMKDPT